MSNSTNTFVIKAEKILRKNMTGGEAWYVSNINNRTNEFTIIDVGPFAKVNLSKSHVLVGNIT